MRARAALSLRVKILVALLPTGAATLAVAAGVLLPRLEHELTVDQLNSLAATARTAGASLSELAPADLTPGSARMRAIVDALERRTGARAVVMDRRNRVLGDSSPDDRPSGAARAALKRNATVRQVVAGSSGPFSEVATPTGESRALVLALVRPSTPSNARSPSSSARSR